MDAVSAKKIFPVFNIKFMADAKTFISVWSQLYNYPEIEKYEVALNKQRFDYDDLLALYKWKNGMSLSGKKLASFENNIASQIDLINELKQSFRRDVFDRAFAPLRAVWKIFLLDIINQDYPTFDQHVYRAFAYIQLQEKRELPLSQTLCMKIYDEQYLPFIWDLQELSPGHSRRQIDQTLWAFGRFMKEYPALFF